MPTIRSFLQQITLIIAAIITGFGFSLFNYYRYPLVPPARAVAGTLTLDGSTSGSASFAGNVTGAAFVDANNSNYKVDPNSNSYFGGNLGLGVTSTSYMLEVNGTSRINGNFTIGDASGDTVTANAAAWTFANDTSLTLSGGTNGLAFDTNTLSIDATNNRIGIGTTSPSTALAVAGEVSSTSANAYRIVYGNYGGFFRQDGSDLYYLLTASGDQYGSWNSLRPLRISNSTGDVYIGNSALYVEHSSGEVGIGTTSPSGTIDVASAANNTGYFLDGKAALTGESADNWLRLNQSSSWSNGTFTPLVMRADGGFNVDSITAIASDNSSHYTYGSSKYDRWGTVNSSGMGFDANNTGNWDLLIYNGGELFFSHEYMGYGGSATIYTYDTNENLVIDPNGSGVVYMYQTADAAPLYMRNDSDSDYYWSVGPHASDNFAIQMNGNTPLSWLEADGAPTGWQYSSDKRLKKNIHSLENGSGLNAIMNLNPVTFNWIDKNTTQKEMTGFIAQEVQKIIPTAVGSNGDIEITLENGATQTIKDSLGVSPTDIIPYTVKAIQEQQKEIDDLQSQINELKKLINEK